MITQINKRLKELTNDNKTIYVLKGFNSIIKDIDFDMEHIFDLKLYENFSNILNDQMCKNVLKKDILKIQDGRSFYCLYEEMYLVGRLNILGFIDDYNIKILDIGLFNNLYPGFIYNGINNLIQQYETDGQVSNILQQIYSEFYVYNGYLVIEYNDLELNNIPTTTQELYNNSTETYFVYTNNENKIIDFYDNAQPQLWVTLFNNVFLEGYNFINYYQIEKSTNFRLQVLMNTLNIFGVSINDKRLIIKDELPTNYEKYEAILKRIDNSYKFKDIDIYEDPFNSSKIKQINQSVIIDTIYQNILKAKNKEIARDIFVTAPTGAGKSVLFQIPAIMAAECENLFTIVISPLIGLMKDQVENIKKMTDCAETINSEFTPIEKDKIKEKIKNGKCSILYVSPETLLSNSDITMFIGDRQIGLLVVDEAHTVATWGKNFRPDYWYLGDYLDKLRHRAKSKYSFPIATFTATATISNDTNNDMYHDIIESLNMTPITYIGDVKRSDINFDIVVHRKEKAYREEKDQIVLSKINDYLNKKEKTLVYFPFVSKLNEIANYLPSDKFGRYFGGLDKFDKDDTLNDLRWGNKSVVLATKAFGMGIDVKDIKNVYHYAPTGNLADYVQEIGRAARGKNTIGVASTDYYEEDFRYINTLYGLSQITNYNIIGVVKKLLYKYQKENKRNFLISAEEFAHVFTAENDSEIESKLKATILALKKDLLKTNNFVPLIFKPRSMYTKGLFYIPDIKLDYIKQIGWDKYLIKKFNDSSLTVARSNGVTRSYIGSVYEMDFKKCWEEKYNDKYKGISFGQFKLLFYNGELPNIDKSVFHDRMILHVSSRYQTFEPVIKQSIFMLDKLKNCFDDIRTINKHFTVEELSERFAKKINMPNAFRKIGNYMESLLNLLISVNANINFNGFNKFCDYHSNTDKYNIVSSYYNRLISILKAEIQAYFKGFENANERNSIVEIDKQKDKIMRSDTLLVAMQILELFELIDYTFSAGDKPEYFVRINSENALKKISENSSYSSDTLAAIFEMHKESVCYMKYFFTQLKSDKERWEFIEKYFLGQVKGNYDIPMEYGSKVKKINQTIEKVEQLRSEQNRNKSDKIMTVYHLLYSEEGLDIVKKFYVSLDEYVIDATRVSPASEIGKKLPNSSVGDVITINEFEYLIEKIEHVKIDLT